MTMTPKTCSEKDLAQLIGKKRSAEDEYIDELIFGAEKARIDKAIAKAPQLMDKVYLGTLYVIAHSMGLTVEQYLNLTPKQRKRLAANDPL